MRLKIYSAQMFSFCSRNVTNFPTSRKFKYFNFAFHTVPGEMLHLEKYFKNFLKLFLAQRRGRWRFWLKISSAQVFWFCNSNVTTFPTSRKYKKFNFSIYQFAAEMLYLLKYLRNFLKLFFGWKKRNLAIVVENLTCTCADIFVLQ